ncbi:MAG: tRNA-dihydrouridine synthase family protein [Geobacteraceae bacterium]|nr:tRNA-dihydrouridine synthase family protein [Geobacteraceae bacterium]
MPLPWEKNIKPLMLAPMQGVTHASMRKVQMELGSPDVLFSEFVPVSNVSRRRISRRDLDEARRHNLSAPLVVQLVGNNPEALMEAALQLQDNGIQHLNLNLGCPYGRMTSGPTGGSMLQDMHLVEKCVEGLRKVAHGGFSVKVRSGYEDPAQIMNLLALFESCGVDFVVLHPRTVVQKYTGYADHGITRRIAAEATVPVIANGDITTPQQGHALLQDSHIAGVMLGRGAIADPWLFRRLRQSAETGTDALQRRSRLRIYLSRLLEECSQTYAGEHQVLAKLKNVVQFVDDPALRRWCGKIKRTRSLQRFNAMLDSLENPAGAWVD